MQRVVEKCWNGKLDALWDGVSQEVLSHLLSHCEEEQGREGNTSLQPNWGEGVSMVPLTDSEPSRC